MIGYCPAITSCARCGRDLRADAHVYASAHAGGAVCAACNSGAREVQKTSLEAMRRMLLLEDNTMCRVRLTPALRAELTTFLTEQVGETLDYGARILAFLKQF